jgi:radical SAM protein with 4Fe4S-binding SPASM domain
MMNEKDQVIIYGCFHPDHIEEMKYFEECKVYTVQIESNLACPQGCLYCYAASDDRQVKELSKKDILAIIDSAARMEVRAIDWLGGDPLVRNDWYELMKYAMDKGLKNNIWTSGIPLEKEEVARKAVEVSDGGFISVHLDSLDEKIYGKLHIPDMINCITFSKPLAGEDVKRTAEYFFNTKGMRTCLTQMCRTGLAIDHPEWIPGINDIKSACEKRDELNDPDSGFSISAMDTSKFYCGGIICVTIDGDVTPCSVIRKGFGNIHDMTLENIMERYGNELLFTQLRDPVNMKGHCNSCNNNSVCWGCRAMAYYETGDMLAPDPMCWINPENDGDK